MLLFFSFNQYPAAKLLIPIILGIILSKILNIHIYFSLGLFILSLTSIISLHIYLNKHYNPFLHKIFGIIAFINFIIGGLLISQKNHLNSNNIIFQKFEHKYIVLYGEISSKPKFYNSVVKLKIKTKAILLNKSWYKFSNQITTFISKEKLTENIEKEDNIILYLKKQKLLAITNKENLDISVILDVNKLIKNDLLVIKEFKIIKNQGFNIFRKIVNKFTNIIEERIKDKDIRAIANAISIGYKDEIEYKIIQNFSKAGAAHILAISGLHVGIIFIIINSLIKKIKCKYTKVSILLIVIWSYATLSGCSPSVLRASLMFSLFSIGKNFNFKPNSYNIIFASALFLLLINPNLLFNPGFQLSYLATIGIIYFYPKLFNLVYTKNKILKYFWSLICVSLSAQLLTFPLVMLHFNTISTLFFISNIIIVPLVPFIISIYFLTIAFNWFEPIVKILIKLLETLISFFNLVINIVNNLPYSYFTEINISLVETLFIYSSILLLIIFINTKNKILLPINAFLFLSFLTIKTLENFKKINQKQIIVYGIKNYSVISFTVNKKTLLIINNDLKNYAYYSIKKEMVNYGIKNNYLLKFSDLYNQFLYSNFILNEVNLFFKKNFFNFYGYKILILNEYTNNLIIKKRIKVNAIIIQKGFKGNIDYYLRYTSPDIVIMDNTCKQEQILQIIQKLDSKKIKYHLCALLGNFKFTFN